MKENITKLFNLGLSNYKISKETGIAQTTLGRFTTGESELGNMTLNNAIKLNDYYNNIKGEIEMKKLVDEIRRDYKVDGENEKYIDFYESAEDIEYYFNKEFFEETFLDSYIQKPNSIYDLSYPIITFSQADSIEDKLYEVTDLENVIVEADQYFDKR